jgi:hypothetical protein
VLLHQGKRRVEVANRVQVQRQTANVHQKQQQLLLMLTFSTINS